MYGASAILPHDFETIPLAYHSRSGYGSLARDILFNFKFGRSSRTSRTFCMHWLHFCSTWSFLNFSWTVHVSKRAKGQVNKIKRTVIAFTRNEGNKKRATKF